jgi:hypothetical protein
MPSLRLWEGNGDNLNPDFMLVLGKSSAQLAFDREGVRDWFALQ